MLITEQIKITNNKPIFTEDQLIQLFVDLQMDDEKRGWGVRNDMCETCLSIILSRKLKKFLDWLPWIKTINIYRLRIRIIREFGVPSSSIYYRDSGWRDHLYKNDRDLQIKILYKLYELGYVRDQYTDIPRIIRCLLIMYYDLNDWLQEFFNEQMERRNFEIFSTRQEENNFNGRWYNSDRRRDQRFNEALTERQIHQAELAQELATYVMNFHNISSTGSTMTVDSSYNEEPRTFYVSGEQFIDGNLTGNSSGEIILRSVTDGTSNDIGVQTTGGERRYFSNGQFRRTRER